MKTKNSKLNYLIWIVLVIFVAVSVMTGFYTYQRAYAMATQGFIFSSSMPDFVPVNPTATLAPGVTLEAAAPVAEVVGPVPEPWDGAGRVTVLLVGLDYRDWEAGSGPPRSDTMMLLTLDPLTKTAGMLSIPRDLWVSIPGFGYGKINTAYSLGEGWNYPGGGPGLAIDTVEAFLGVPINFYAQVDFAAFEQFIDELGGIDVNVPQEIKVDPIGPHNTVTLDAGVQTLDGPTALAYARARYSEGGDFDRAARQQQVVRAIRDKILRQNMLPSLVANAPTLYAEIGGGVHTNMTLDQALSLAWIAKDIPTENFHSGIIGPPNQVILTKSPDGSQDILKPITENIRTLRDEIFTTGSILPASTDQELLDLLAAEGAQITLLNGSGVPGLAAETQEYLSSLGANITVTGDANQYYARTTIVDYTGNPYTMRYFRTLFNVEAQYRRLDYTPGSTTDMIIYLGADWATTNSLP